MAESDPPTTEPVAEATKAQAEFARFKNRAEQAAAAATGPGASFASPLPSSAIPAWSLQPAPGAPGPREAGSGPWGPAAPSGGGKYASIVDGVGTTIRLGVEVLNAALSSSLTMLNGVGDTGGRGLGSYGCDACSACGGQCGYDCCSVLGSCGCCEPRVGTCW